MRTLHHRYQWFTELRCDRTSSIDAERSGRTVEVAIPETIEKIRNMGKWFRF